MSTSWWDEDAVQFAQNFAEVSTGMHQAHKPEISITPVEQGEGLYRLCIDKEAVALTAQDLLDIMDWCLLNARVLSQQAKEQA